MFLHIISGSIAILSVTARIAYITYIGLAMVFYLYHLCVCKVQLKRNAYTVIENRTENTLTCSLHLKPLHGSFLNYKTGQFAFISVHNKILLPEFHPFTIASSPLNKDELEFVIKASGDYTSHLDQVHTGDKVWVDGPFGIFSHTNYPAEESLVFVAGGIGITPFLSMLRTLKVQDPQRQVILLWGCRLRTDLILADEFKSFEASMPNFRWYPVLSDEPEWTGEKGFFDKEKLNRLGIAMVDLKKTGFYTCGPPIMMRIVDEALQELGIPGSRIHYEKFSF